METKIFIKIFRWIFSLSFVYLPILTIWIFAGASCTRDFEDYMSKFPDAIEDRDPEKAAQIAVDALTTNTGWEKHPRLERIRIIENSFRQAELPYPTKLQLYKIFFNKIAPHVYRANRTIGRANITLALVGIVEKSHLKPSEKVEILAEAIQKVDPIGKCDNRHNHFFLMGLAEIKAPPEHCLHFIETMIRMCPKRFFEPDFGSNYNAKEAVELINRLEVPEKHLNKTMILFLETLLHNSYYEKKGLSATEKLDLRREKITPLDFVEGLGVFNNLDISPNTKKKIVEEVLRHDDLFSLNPNAFLLYFLPNTNIDGSLYGLLDAVRLDQISVRLKQIKDEEPYLRAKVLPIKASHIMRSEKVKVLGIANRLFDNLPENLRPRNISEVKTLVLYETLYETVGRYFDMTTGKQGGYATRVDSRIIIIDVPKKLMVAFRHFRGSNPAAAIKVNKNQPSIDFDYGSEPTDEAISWLLSLPLK